MYLSAKAIERLPWIADVQQFPAVLEWRGKLIVIDTTGLLALAARPIDLARAFRLSGLSADSTRAGAHQDAPDAADRTDADRSDAPSDAPSDTDRSDGPSGGVVDVIDLYRELRAKGWGRERARKAGNIARQRHAAQPTFGSLNALFQRHADGAPIQGVQVIRGTSRSRLCASSPNVVGSDTGRLRPRVSSTSLRPDASPTGLQSRSRKPARA